MSATHDDGSNAPLVAPQPDAAGPTVGGYDEFGLLHENAAEYGIPWQGPPQVTRASVAVTTGRLVSALVWGESDPQVVLIHGGAQNAHTWDTVGLALGVPLVAVDLPGHGHSSWRDDLDYSPPALAADVAVAVSALAPNARLVVGMSLGGLTSMVLASRHAEVVRRLAVVDVTPGTTREKAAAIVAFISGPQRFDSFDDILERTIAHNPTRSVSSLRRGVLHNARPVGDGGWMWRYDRRRREEQEVPDTAALWEDVGRIQAPLLLIRGALSPVVDDDDVAELRRRQPGAGVVVVDGAGHSVQGDKPLELAAILAEFGRLG